MNDRVLSYCMGQRFLKIVSVRKPTDSQLRAMQEFHPYVFQIFAQLIEMHPGELPAFYLSSCFSLCWRLCSGSVLEMFLP